MWTTIMQPEGVTCVVIVHLAAAARPQAAGVCAAADEERENPFFAGCPLPYKNDDRVY